MAEKYYTVEQISELLRIHPKTVQRYIREGKLRASKIGKSWRVTGHDLSVFAESTQTAADSSGQSPNTPPQEGIQVSTVADIPVRGKEEAIRIVNALTAVLNSKPPEYGRSSMHTQYIEQQNMVRVSLWGGIRFAEALIASLSALTEQAEE